MLAVVALCLSSPLIAFCALVVLLGSGRPVILRQQRVGLGGRCFMVFKFRTMKVNPGGHGFTASGDARVTAPGRLLRLAKLDELPELWNILIGEMSFVGPRPEVPQYVDLKDPLWHFVLQVRPGLTDPVTLKLRHEETLLASVTGDLEVYYKTVLVPFKLRGYAQYLEHRTWQSDVRLLLQTIGALFRSAHQPVDIDTNVALQSASKKSISDYRNRQ